MSLSKPIIAKRLIVKPCDIQVLTGVSEKSARRQLNKLRKKLGKGKDDYILIEEYCKATGVPFATMLAIVNQNHAALIEKNT
jgi:hypothetical protein